MELCGACGFLDIQCSSHSMILHDTSGDCLISSDSSDHLTR